MPTSNHQLIIEQKNNEIHQLKEIIRNLPIDIYWKDKDGVWLGVNETGLNSLKRMGFISDGDQIIGKKDIEIFSKETASIFRKNDIQVMETGDTAISEETQYLPSGKKLTFLSTKTPLFKNEKKEIMGIIGVSIDITEKKNAERLRLEKTLSDKKAHYTKMAAGSIAHDLRSPLAAIGMGMSSVSDALSKLIEAYRLAKEAGVDVPSIRNHRLDSLSHVIERCHNQVDFSNNYINMILNNLQHDSIDTSSYQMHAMVPIIDDVLDSYPFEQGEKERVHNNVSSDFKFWGSEVYIKNILNNLLKNALYYIRAEQKGEVYLSSRETPNHFVLQFKDTAKGAPPEVTKNMFDSYFSKRTGGTGLGLAFCKNVMESCQGDITADSVEGEYMTFSLFFPKTVTV